MRERIKRVTLKTNLTWRLWRDQQPCTLIWVRFTNWENLSSGAGRALKLVESWFRSECNTGLPMALTSFSVRWSSLLREFRSRMTGESWLFVLPCPELVMSSFRVLTSYLGAEMSSVLVLLSWGRGLWSAGFKLSDGWWGCNSIATALFPFLLGSILMIKCHVQISTQEWYSS